MILINIPSWLTLLVSPVSPVKRPPMIIPKNLSNELYLSYGLNFDPGLFEVRHQAMHNAAITI